MASGYQFNASEDADSRPSNLNDLDPALRPPSAEMDSGHDSAPALISDNASTSNESHVSSLQVVNAQICLSRLTRASAFVQAAHATELESQTVTSDDTSFDSDTPLANRRRRRNRPIPLDQLARQLRSSRTEDLEDSTAIISTSEEDMAVFHNPYPLTARQRRHDTFHPIAPAAHLLPPRGRRQVYTRQDMRLALAPSPGASSRDSPAAPPSTRSIPAEFGYGYGYGGHDRSHFYLIEDLSNPRPVSDPTGQRAPRPSRFVLFNPRVLTGQELEALEEQTAAMARYEQSLDLFPGIELSSSDEEESLSGSAFEESPVHDAITVPPEDFEDEMVLPMVWSFDVSRL